VTETPRRWLTPRRATWLVLRRPEQRTLEEHHLLAHLTAQHAELADAIALAQEFAQLARQRQAPQLDPWLARAAESRVTSLQRCAKGLRDDYEAVKAGVTVPWSTGPVADVTPTPGVPATVLVSSAAPCLLPLLACCG
jgi:transposase